jgi:predicted metalloprotease
MDEKTQTIDDLHKKQQQWMENIRMKMGTYQKTRMIMFRKMVRTNRMKSSL